MVSIFQRYGATRNHTIKLLLTDNHQTVLHRQYTVCSAFEPPSKSPAGLLFWETIRDGTVVALVLPVGGQGCGRC